MNRLARFFITMWLLCGSSVLAGQLEVASLFSDGMVLQQGMMVPVWGWGEPGETVTVEFAGQKKTAVVDSSKHWEILLDPMPVSSKPRKMTISSQVSRFKVQVSDVLIGEVWLCSGQSNMGMGMNGVENAKEEMAAADYPAIRMFRPREAPAEEPWKNVEAEWKACTPQTIMSYSAMAYYFARHLHKETGSPVGIVVSAWGGSAVASWMSREALQAEPVRCNMPADVLGWRANIRPSKLYNGMLHPLAPYALAGAIWYQGESDSEPGANPYRYRLLFPEMIKDWRRLWNRPELPFYFVQLPNMSRPDDTWAVLRESQQAALALPRTGMVATLDLNRENKLHPPNKKEFGERLCNLVLQKEYGSKIDAECPLFQTLEVAKGRIRIAFSNVRKLKTTDGQAPKGFRIAGKDRVFVEADVRIGGRAVEVSNPRVPLPVAVRYAFETDPPVNLCGENSLPAAPFRTDDWPVPGEESTWKDLPGKEVLGTQCPPAGVMGGTDDGWQWCGQPEALDDKWRDEVMRPLPSGLVQLKVRPVWMLKPQEERPMPAWETSGKSPFAGFDPAKGCTVELTAKIFKTAAPFHGLDMELGLPGQDGTFYRYQLSIQLMRIHGFANEEVHVMGTNLDNAAEQHTYRIAVRPDGCAQVYMDARTIGVLPREEVDISGDSVPYFRWGKSDPKGQLSAHICEVGFDTGGGYAPPN